MVTLESVIVFPCHRAILVGMTCYHNCTLIRNRKRHGPWAMMFSDSACYNLQKHRLGFMYSNPPCFPIHTGGGEKHVKDGHCTQRGSP
jgi:hypothetical protein